jgi:hypothetical protein
MRELWQGQSQPNSKKKKAVSQASLEILATPVTQGILVIPETPETLATQVTLEILATQVTQSHVHRQAL